MAAERPPRLCPYSAETIVACPAYEPQSAHASAPGSEQCRHVVIEQQGPVRRLRCVRGENVEGVPSTSNVGTDVAPAGTLS